VGICVLHFVRPIVLWSECFLKERHKDSGHPNGSFPCRSVWSSATRLPLLDVVR
jgi:hypothetical protein